MNRTMSISMENSNLKDYPDIDYDSINFPSEAYIAYAVCRKSCGNKEFIVDGETQICEHCGHNMFRTEEKRYVLAENHEKMLNKPMQNFVSDEVVVVSDEFHLNDYPTIAPESIKFPNELFITYVLCRKECGASGFIVEGQTDICEYCGHHMRHTLVEKYVLAEDQD